MQKVNMLMVVIPALLLCLVTGGTGTVTGAQGADPPYTDAAVEPNRARVLMLVPYDFSGFVYVSRFRGSETANRFGPEAIELFRAALGGEFATFAVDHVTSEAAAKAMISPDSPDHASLAQFDYLAIPKFDRVGYWTEGSEYGFDIDIIVDFHPITGTLFTSIKGHGETKTGAQSGTSPGASGSIALKNAVDAVRDGVIKWRNKAVQSGSGR